MSKGKWCIYVHGKNGRILYLTDCSKNQECFSEDKSKARLFTRNEARKEIDRYFTESMKKRSGIELGG